MTSIGLAVPCYGPHISKLAALLQSIESQTLRPAQVVISCSGAAPEDLAHLQGGWPFPVRIDAFPHRRNAAQNRNAAARVLDTDLISYLDADDTMHPQRLEILTRIFDDTGVDVVLHGCASPPHPLYEAAFPPLPEPWPVTVNSPGSKSPESSTFTPVHGHVTVTRVLAQRIGQPENLSFERREDSEFVDRLIATPGIRSAFVDLALTKYVSAGTWVDAPDGSGSYALGKTGSVVRDLMDLPLLNSAKRPMQAFWRGLPLSIRQRFLK
jgi:hypothetical protein